MGLYDRPWGLSGDHAMKRCEECGAEIVRYRNAAGKLQQRTIHEAKRFCSDPCRAEAMIRGYQKTRNVKPPPGDEVPGWYWTRVKWR